MELGRGGAHACGVPRPPLHAPLYRGDDTYRTRDYRFLGSIGYWDSLYLPLEEGENELVVAVSEDFGGWVVQAHFPDAAGLTL